MKKKRVLITGSSGFIGTNLCEKLTSMGHEIIPYDLKIGMDVLNKKQLKSCLGKADTVVHLASPSSSLMFVNNPDECMMVALEGLRNIISQWNGNLIFPSTCTLYGISDEPVTENQALPAFPNRYAESKVRSEDLCLSANRNGTKVTILRIFSGFGPGETHKGEYASPAYKFINCLVQNKEILVYGTGRQARDFVYIDDITSAIIKSINYSGDKLIFNIGSGVSTIFNDLICKCEYLVGARAKCRYVLPPNGYVSSIVANISLAKQELDFIPLVSVDDALAKMAICAINNHNSNR